MSAAESFLASSAGMIVVALIIEALLGYPPALYRAIRHPVVWIGGCISLLDTCLNRPAWSALPRRLAGVACVLIVLCLGGGVALAIAFALPDTWPGRLAEAAIAATLLAQRSLADHVAAVAAPLGAAQWDEARGSLAKIVGRDVRALDESGMARGAIESLAENFSDGVIAPAFWGALFGLPGIALYKCVNTLDSMIGHRTPRHEAFGWAAARLDDLVNLIPARLTALLLCIASLTRAPNALAAAVRDAGKHRSPNAGWPEAAMAGALNVRLSGPRSYHGAPTNEPWIYPAGLDARAADIRRALSLYAIAAALFCVGLAIVAGGFAA